MGRRKNHPGSISRRGPSYRVRLCVAGERRYFTLNGVTRSEAESFARNKYQELQEEAERRSAGLPTGVLFSGLLKAFKTSEMPNLTEGTQVSYRDSLKVFETYFVKREGDPRIDKIRAGHIRQFLTWRRTHGPQGNERNSPLSNRTVAKDRAVLHRLFELADQWELRDGNPVARTQPPKSDGRDPVILSDQQLHALLDQCGERPMLKMYVLFLAETGARCESEALWTRWEDVDFKDGFVWIASGRDGHRTKSGQGRWVPLTDRLGEALRAHGARFRLATYQGERSPWIFHHTRAWRNAKPGDRIGSLRRSFASAADRAKLPDEFVQHDLRHRRVTTWLAEGKSPALVKEAMGHSDLRTTMGYMHLAKSHLRALVDETRRERLLRELR